MLRSRSEQGAGYRRALDYLFTQAWRPLNLGLLLLLLLHLHLHRELYAETGLSGGRLKESDNLVADRSPGRSVGISDPSGSTCQVPRHL